MLDNLLTATNTTRTSLSNLKKKLSKIRIQVDDLAADLEKVDTKFENVLSQAEIYKSKLERELGREVRRLERELALLRNASGGVMTPAQATESDLKVASTIGIFDTILRHMCANAEDFRLASEAFLFPVVYERVMDGAEEAYYLEEIPVAAPLVIKRGQEYIQWMRQEYDTHVTDPETWAEAIDYVVEWWRNDALPMIYGARDEQWTLMFPCPSLRSFCGVSPLAIAPSTSPKSSTPTKSTASIRTTSMEPLVFESSNSNSSPSKMKKTHSHALDPVDHLIAKVGIGMVLSLIHI